MGDGKVEGLSDAGTMSDKDLPLSREQWWYGRDEPPLAPQLLRAGPVTALLVGRDLRNVRYGATEIAQRVYVAVRDRNWDTVPGEVSDLTVDQGDDRFVVRFTVRHRQHDIDFTWRGEIVGEPDGTVGYAMDATAGMDMTYKLIGLNVHHGMQEYAGRPCHGVTPDGPIADAFSRDVAPQLVADLTEVPIFPPVESLTAELAEGVTVRFDYEGDTFEFEDQRNWTDASFKSQSYPPRRNGFNTIATGGRVWQKVTITPSGTPPPVPAAVGPVRVTLGERVGRVPPLGFGMASHGGELSARETELLRALRPDHLRVDLRLAEPGYPAALGRAIAAAALGCGLEVAIHLTDDADAQLHDLAARLDGVRVDRVLVFHTGQAATDPRWVALARQRLGPAAPGALFAGGTNANFCELNRFRPEGAADDGIVYSINPQIHAFDERSLAENIGAQAETVRTARAFGGGRPIVVSPVTFRQRFNAVATSGQPEPPPGELPPQVDPRQMSLFGAGWTVGSLGQLLASQVAAATYYETTGWRGVIQGDAPPSAPERFPARAGMVFPLYHVFADLAERKGGQVVRTASSDPLAVTTLAIADDDGVRLLMANLTPEPQAVTIDGLPTEALALRRLNAETAEAAAFAPARFRSLSETVAAVGPLVLTLAPFELVRIDAPLGTR
jgi:D-apionolactonase